MDYFYINEEKNLDKFNFYEGFIVLSIVLTIITIITGGFMAGTHAGQSFNTYPLMNGKIIPDDYYLRDLGLLNMFENTVAINFNHRWVATITFLNIFIFCVKLSIFIFVSTNSGFMVISPGTIATSSYP